MALRRFSCWQSTAQVKTTSLVGIALALTLTAAACGGPSTGPDAPTTGLDFERVEENNSVTVVNNKAGSVWGAPARLVEELTIGVMEGDENYMLSRPSAFAATDDEIFILDGQDNVVRVYGRDGTYRRQFGQAGEGPGEFNNPFAMLITDDDQVLVSSGFGSSRLSVFTLAGEHIDDWSVGERPVFRLFNTVGGVFGNRWIVSDDPAAVMSFDRPEAYQRIGGDGYLGEPQMVPSTGHKAVSMKVDFQGRTMEMPVPGGTPPVVWALMRDGALIHGWPGEYRFEVRRSDDSVMAVERYWDPVPFVGDERDYHRRLMVASLRRNLPDFDWDGDEMPDHKPAYMGLADDGEGNIWVYRQGPGVENPDCIQPEDWDPASGPGGFIERCWMPSLIIDVFAPDGRYLGEVAHGEAQPPGFLRGDLAIAGVQDEFGTPLVKVYRLALPTDS